MANRHDVQQEQGTNRPDTSDRAPVTQKDAVVQPGTLADSSLADVRRLNTTTPENRGANELGTTNETGITNDRIHGSGVTRTDEVVHKTDHDPFDESTMKSSLDKLYKPSERTTQRVGHRNEEDGVIDLGDDGSTYGSEHGASSVRDQSTAASGASELPNSIPTDRPTTKPTPDAGGDRRIQDLSPEDQAKLEAMEKDLKDFGKPPEGALTQLMRDNQVVAIGEAHGPQDPQRMHGNEYLRSLREGGATHLVIEAPQELKPMLDKFNETGVLDEAALPVLARNPEYIALLQTAREVGLKVVPGDGPQANADDPIRNRTMANTIRGILDEPNQDPAHPNKVAFWVGSLHLSDTSQTRPAGSMSEGTAAEQLRQAGVNLATVNYEDPRGYSVLGKLASSVEQPTMVSTHDAQTIGSFVRPSGISLRNASDYLIFYPPEKR